MLKPSNIRELHLSTIKGSQRDTSFKFSRFPMTLGKPMTAPRQGKNCQVPTPATGYGLDGLRTESRWRRDIQHLSRLALEPTQPPVQWVSGISQG